VGDKYIPVRSGLRGQTQAHTDKPEPANRIERMMRLAELIRLGKKQLQQFGESKCQ